MNRRRRSRAKARRRVHRAYAAVLAVSLDRAPDCYAAATYTLVDALYGAYGSRWALGSVATCLHRRAPLRPTGIPSLPWAAATCIA